MKNLAGNKLCDLHIREELDVAHIPIVTEQSDPRYSEVLATVCGQLGEWKFVRYWTYWAACAPEGHGLPRATAEKLNRYMRDQVRVAGFAGGADVEGWLSEADTIDSYNVDTIGGLRELSLVIRTGQTDSRVAAWEEDAAQAELAKTK